MKWCPCGKERIEYGYCPDRAGCRLAKIKKGFEKHTRQEGDCLIWTGRIATTTKRGILRLNGEVLPAGRAALELAGHPFPKGTHITPTCGNQLCVAVDHLNARKGREYGPTEFYGVQLPAEPLMRLYEKRREAGWKAPEGSSLNTIEKARERGVVNLLAADAIAIDYFKMHPADIWGELFWTAERQSA